MKNNAIRTIRSEEITIDVRICAALAANRGSGEVYLAAIAPDMELTIITLDEAPGILPLSLIHILQPVSRCCQDVLSLFRYQTG